MNQREEREDHIWEDIPQLLKYVLVANILRRIPPNFCVLIFCFKKLNIFYYILFYKKELLKYNIR